MDDKTLIITTEDGKEIVVNILFTYHSDEYNKDYVVFEDKDGVTSASVYKDLGEGKGELSEIESDEEWNMLEELLNSEDEEEEE